MIECTLPETGSELWLAVVAVAVILTGAVLLLLARGRRGRVATLVVAGLLIGVALPALLPPAPASAACPPAATPAPTPTPITSTALSLSPASATATVGDPVSVILSNTGSIPAEALNIAPGAGVSIVSTNCASSLNPSADCEIVVTAGTAVSGTVTVSADNAAAVDATVTFSAPSAVLTATPAALVFAPGGTGTITVSNASATLAAIDIAATVPPGANLSVAASNCGASLPPGASCTITLTSPTSESTSILISGANTNTVTVTVDVN